MTKISSRLMPLLLLTLNQHFNGSMALPKGFFKAADIVMNEDTRAGTIVPAELWSYGVIPYAIDQTFSASHQADIVEAMRRIQSVTCLQFRWVEVGDPYYIYFTNHDDYACGSYVGRQTSMYPQLLWVNPRCIDFNGLIHEVVHAVGIWHTQQRVDRDQYVRIDWEALYAGLAQGFITEAQIKSAYTRVDQFDFDLRVSNYDVPYDYTSIMHYPSSWGQIPGVITPFNNPPEHYGSPEEMADWWDAPRDKVGLSQGDIEMISKMYANECARRR